MLCSNGRFLTPNLRVVPNVFGRLLRCDHILPWILNSRARIIHSQEKA